MRMFICRAKPNFCHTAQGLEYQEFCSIPIPSTSIWFNFFSGNTLKLSTTLVIAFLFQFKICGYSALDGLKMQKLCFKILLQVTYPETVLPVLPTWSQYFSSMCWNMKGWLQSFLNWTIVFIKAFDPPFPLAPFSEPSVRRTPLLCMCLEN